MIVLIALLVVVGALAAVLSYLAANNAMAGGAHLGSVRALFLAESGLEFEQRRWAQILDWYRSASDPNPAAAAPQAFGNGSFTVYSNLPATLMRTGASAGTATINVYTTDRFPTAGILQIEDDITGGGEFVRYTGVTANSFTGVSRAQTVGTVTSVASVHSRSDRVYPVTILRTTMAANCNAMASIQIDANSKFLSAGTLDIEGEEVGYAGSTTSGGTTTLTGIMRCLDATTLATPASHAIGQPVTPVLVGGDSADYQVEAISTGTQGTNIRYAKRTIQR
jgi:hypothetical protein